MRARKAPCARSPSSSLGSRHAPRHSSRHASLRVRRCDCGCGCGVAGCDGAAKARRPNVPQNRLARRGGSRRPHHGPHEVPQGDARPPPCAKASPQSGKLGFQQRSKRQSDGRPASETTSEQPGWTRRAQHARRPSWDSPCRCDRTRRTPSTARGRGRRLPRGLAARASTCATTAPPQARVQAPPRTRAQAQTPCDPREAAAQSPARRRGPPDETP